jgi:hypothetical protein
MHARRVFELFTLTFLCALFLSTTPVALASTQISIGSLLYQNTGANLITGRYSNTVNSPQNRMLVHSTGKILILTYDDISNIRLHILDSVGVEIYSHVIATGGGSHGSLVGGCTLAEYSSTQVIIAFSDSLPKLYFYLININSFTNTEYSTTMAGTSGATTTDMIGQLYYYNGYWQIMVLYNSYSSGSKVSFASFRVSTLAASNNGASAYSHYGYTSQIMSFQDSLNLNLIYIVSSKAGASAGDQTTPEYYVYDMGTTTLSLLATNGINGVLPEASSTTYTQPYSNMINYMGGGIYQSGSFYYLYHAWEYSYSSYPTGLGVRYVKVAEWVGKFNNTISSGTLVSQVMRTYDASDLSLTTASTPGVGYGYLYMPSASAGQILYAYYQDVYGSAHKYISKVTLSVTDITTMSSSWDNTQIIIKVDNQDFSLVGGTSCNVNMMKDNLHGITYAEWQATSSGYLFIGESLTVITYTVTESYTPSDTPLVTNKNYVFTWSIYANGVLDNYNDTYKIFLDGIEAKPGTISLGIATMSMTVPLAGIHTLFISVYHLGTFEYSSAPVSHSWIASTSTPGSGGTPSIGGGYYNLMTIWVPIGLFVVLPMFGLAFVGGKYAGGTGMVIGMLGGGFAGVVGGTQLLILPGYYLWLYILFMGIALALSITIGRSGGDSA